MTNTQALQQLIRSTRYNITQARADLNGMGYISTADDYYHQGYQTGRIAAMESLADSLESLV
jgi:hypothetical protein